MAPSPMQPERSWTLKVVMAGGGSSLIAHAQRVEVEASLPDAGLATAEHFEKLVRQVMADALAAITPPPKEARK